MSYSSAIWVTTYGLSSLPSPVCRMACRQREAMNCSICAPRASPSFIAANDASVWAFGLSSQPGIIASKAGRTSAKRPSSTSASRSLSAPE
ncbi:MAG TPA: hypothetical protein VFS43_12200 [Polyangiaceae bacterium]|nr:hypothetical protein [Polyangiaceae bacterium]